MNDPRTIPRASAYLARVPAAISGAGGHDATFKAAIALVQGFDMAPEQALPLLQEWNRGCQPPWSDADLRHKLVDADKVKSTKPRGYLLGEATPSRPRPLRPAPPPPPPKPLPRRDGFTKGTPDQLLRLAESRPYHLDGLTLASERGFLVFGLWHELECYGVTDNSGRVLELRRMDGKLFPADHSKGLDERKCHSVRGSQKRWPVGIQEARGLNPIALLEGIPDFLTAHHVVVSEAASNCVPVAMLSSSPSIHEEALVWFVGKHVRIFAHADQKGLEGAAKWQKQLLEAGAEAVDIFDFSHYRKSDGGIVKDLWEFVHLGSNQETERMLP